MVMAVPLQGGSREHWVGWVLGGAGSEGCWQARTRWEAMPIPKSLG